MVGTALRAIADRGRSVPAILAMLLIVPTLTAPPAARADEAPRRIVFDGGGWGHGVGMSQYGAKGQALEGRSAADIVTHYYSGTEVRDVADLPIPDEERDRPLWVGLDQSVTTANFVWSAEGGTVCIEPGAGGSCSSEVSIRSSDSFAATWDPAAAACTLVRTRDGVASELNRVAPDCRLSMRGDPGATIWFQARGYAAATIELRRSPGTETFHVVAVIDIETYVGGIAEVPGTWPVAAVEAQALAARSFGLNRYLTFEKPELRTDGDAGLDEATQQRCWCHMYDDTRSQVYGGVEAATSGRVAAAAATAGRVIAYRGADWAGYTRHQVIEAYYSSSTAGHTISNVAAWGSTKLYPYLVGVDDSWAVAEETQNPNAAWTDSSTVSDLSTTLGWDTIDGAWLVADQPATVLLEGSDDGTPVSAELRGDSLRGTASLLSGHVTALRLEGTPSCGGYFATIVGTAHGDHLNGTPGDDVIVGRGGDDVISGGAGSDVICGNGGNDVLKGNTGGDTIYAGNGDDTVLGGGGADSISGGGGADVIDGGNGGDTIDGDKGLDTIRGEGGADTLRGGAGADWLDGGNGADSVIGNSGGDTLAGGANGDGLWGGPGPDVLDGGDGTDDCRGGDGVDDAAGCESTWSIP